MVNVYIDNKQYIQCDMTFHWNSKIFWMKWHIIIYVFLLWHPIINWGLKATIEHSTNSYIYVRYPIYSYEYFIISDPSASRMHSCDSGYNKDKSSIMIYGFPRKFQMEFSVHRFVYNENNISHHKSMSFQFIVMNTRI